MLHFLLPCLGDLVALVSLPGTIELGLLTTGNFFAEPKNCDHADATPRLAVVVPAHNESGSIADCLASLSACDRSCELATVFVIADNCSDDTAAVARSCGTNVLVREEPDARGKGYALRFAFEQLIAREYDAFLIVDADSTVDAKLIEKSSAAFRRGAKAVQCSWLVADPERSPLPDLALRAFNLVRLKGRSGLNLSAGILGNGFGISKDALDKVPYTADSVVEDLEYHLNLVQAGIKVEYVRGTVVRGAMPNSKSGRESQRARWEGGRLRMLRERFSYLAVRSLRRPALIEVLLELLTLPLAYHAALLMLALLTPSPFGRIVAAIGIGVLTFHIAVASAAGKNPRRDVAAIMKAPIYLAWKLVNLTKTVKASARSAVWVRTERSEEVAHGHQVA